LKSRKQQLINVKKPFILFGQGVIQGSRRRIRLFVEKSGIPAAWTI
jgi:acetolactate synthase-1/2/3 large subunit